MTRPVYVPADAVVPIVDWLAVELVVRFPGIVVSQALSRDWRPGMPSEVVVADDGGGLRWPVTTDPTIRVTVWADGRDTARDIGGHTLGLLLCRRVPGIAQIRPSTALLDSQDSRNGGWLSTFNVRTRVRTVAV
mgnify:CR=1 FL=1